MRRKFSTTLISSISCISASTLISGCATPATDDYEAIFIGYFKVVQQDEHRPLLSATIKFDKDRNGYIAYQSPGQDGYTSVHLWACKSFDAHQNDHAVQQVKCGGDDGQEYWFYREVVPNDNSGEVTKVELVMGRVNLYLHHYVLSRIIPAS
jgi:hypothetical protein